MAGALLARFKVAVPHTSAKLVCISARSMRPPRLHREGLNLQPLTHGRAAIELAILVLVWVAFYGFYFTRFGW